MIKTSHKTFNDVVKEIQTLDPDNLLSWFRLVVDTYLTQKEKIILEAQKAQLSGQVKQRELSVIFSIAQPHLSVNLRKLKRKIVTVHAYLKEGKICTEYAAAPELFTVHQYRILSYVLAGYTPKAIARIHSTTHVNANICVSALLRKLQAQRAKYPAMCKFVEHYKRNFV